MEEVSNFDLTAAGVDLRQYDEVEYIQLQSSTALGIFSFEFCGR